VKLPETRYARSSALHIAYQVFGVGAITVVNVPGFATHVELAWEYAGHRLVAERVARYARVVIFDKRGTGLSDRIAGVPSLEERMDDLRAVMDAVGVERAVISGSSEGGPMAILFAATYPERTQALVLSGSFARFAAGVDYPIGRSREEWERIIPWVERRWGTGRVLAAFNPEFEHDAEWLAQEARFERNAASPGAAAALIRMNLDIDVRSVLPALQVPTFVAHNTGDPVFPVEHGRYLAEHIPDARYVERPVDRHGVGPQGYVPSWHDDLEEFLTGSRPAPRFDRVLATVLFTDIVGSTELASRLGDEAWRGVLDEHDDRVKEVVARYRGRHVQHTGDGLVATFDGPARAVECGFAIRSALAPLGLHVRAGAHTGEIELRGNNIAGIAVHLAARIAAIGNSEEVLVSRVVKDLVAGSGLTFTDRGAHTLKGIPEPQTLYSVQTITHAE
jgi:class 3 adenylate cyclase/alpha-beta hydrolase superfamily lysophospholipase